MTDLVRSPGEGEGLRGVEASSEPRVQLVGRRHVFNGEPVRLDLPEGPTGVNVLAGRGRAGDVGGARLMITASPRRLGGLVRALLLCVNVRPVWRQCHALVPRRLQRIHEHHVTECCEVSDVERGVRDDEHLPQPALGFQDEDLCEWVKLDIVAMLEVPKLAPQKLTHEEELLLVKESPLGSPGLGHRRDGLQDTCLIERQRGRTLACACLGHSDTIARAGAGSA